MQKLNFLTISTQKLVLKKFRKIVCITFVNQNKQKRKILQRTLKKTKKLRINFGKQNS